MELLIPPLSLGSIINFICNTRKTFFMLFPFWFSSLLHNRWGILYSKGGSSISREEPICCLAERVHSHFPMVWFPVKCFLWSPTERAALNVAAMKRWLMNLYKCIQHSVYLGVGNCTVKRDIQGWWANGVWNCWQIAFIMLFQLDSFSIVSALHQCVQIDRSCYREVLWTTVVSYRSYPLR